MNAIGLTCLTIVTTGMCQASAPPANIPDDPLWERQVSYRNPGGTITFDIASWRASARTFRCVRGIDLNLTRAWSITTGSEGVVVAILDDGFFYDHEDIRENIWRNSGEVGIDEHGYDKRFNGVDDDANGYVDDVMGWDFAFGDPDPDGYVFDGMDPTRVQPYSHSIPALGIIGARGDNGVGVAGINWRVSMMLLKIGAQGIRRGEVDTRRPHRAAEAIRYAADNGAKVINWSGFVNDTSPEALAVLREAIDYAASKRVLLVVAAGNNANDIDLEENFLFPQCFDNENILTVAEIDFRGELDRNSGRHRISGSCFGVRKVDVAALARNYTTALRHGRSAYRLGGGSSNSAPVATGVAGLILSVRPDLDGLQVKQIIMDSVRPLPALEGRILSGGMVDALAAVELAQRFNVTEHE